jgi:hypothetical protein
MPRACRRLRTAITRSGRTISEAAVVFGGCCRRSDCVDYNVNAPSASLNDKVGRFALGASVRYDFGNARGSIFGSDLGGGRVGTTARDMNGDGVISAAERRVAVIPLTSPTPVDCGWHYLSYSSGINFRVSVPFAMFVRYSRGGARQCRPDVVRPGGQHDRRPFD